MSEDCQEHKAHTPHLKAMSSCTKFVLLQNTGAGIFYNVRGGGRVLSKNSIIDITTLVVPFFRCLSGSSSPNVGSLIGPHGTDITFATSDPFLVIRGGSNDPGTLLVRKIRHLVSKDSGISIPTDHQMKMGTFWNFTLEFILPQISVNFQQWN